MFTRLLYVGVLGVLASMVANTLANKHSHHEHHVSSTAATPTPAPTQDGPLTVSQSGRFRGSWMETRRGRRFQAYRGIRYAEPPVGPLRFEPPKPILHYKGEVDASDDGPSCPLIAPPEYPVDEDCLTINVYTPDNKSKKPLPVIFFMHPGGFYAFNGRSDVVGPHYLLDHDVILVSINYRLSILGFLSTGDEHAPGNNGFRDQVAALRWVQRNIAAFGGDPNLVTIAGVSAGSISVLLHMISDMSKGLFHRGISISGSPTEIPLPHDLRRLAVRQAELLNCPSNDSKAMIDCFRSKPWQDFRSWYGFYEFGFDPVGIFPPVVEKDFGQERFLAVQPIDAIREGKFRSVPHIISQTEEEFFWMAYTVINNETLRTTMNEEWERVAPISFMLPRENAAPKVNRLREYFFKGKPIVDDEFSRKALGRLYADAAVGFSVHRMANLMCRHSSQPVYYYEFSYIGNHSFYEDPVTGKPTAAAHHDDMIYLFTLSFRFPTIPTTSPDSHIVDKMTAIWYNFARYGDPHPRKGDNQPELKDLHWPTMKPDNRKYLRIADQFSVHKNLYEDRFQVWEDLYPIKY